MASGHAQEERHNVYRIIIFCQPRKQCTELNGFYKQKLRPEDYHFSDEDQQGNVPECLFGMYHLTTLAKQKQIVLDSF